MIEIRFHGRGGQGTVVASKILADALAKEGNFVQAYPEFGVERRGAPVISFIRVDSKQIFDKSRIYAPDHVVVVDPTLVEAIDVTEGLKDGGWIIINSDRSPGDFRLPDRFKIATINATGIAVQNRLGTLAAPIVNTAMVGAIIRILDLTRLDSLLAAIAEAIPVKSADNQKAAAEAYERAGAAK
jgi:2-oxoisovalerate/pyruvate ferredoxin oxidoreductase gamma subunit